MSNEAKIKIGLLGGRGYGKTVFLTKLISLADNSEDGFLQFDAGSESLQIKNLLLENEGKLPATEIREFSKYKFILGKQSGEKWKVQFCDYAGELLERIDIPSDNKTKANDRTADSIEDIYASTDGNAPYIKRLKKWLHCCDAYIILMPVDIKKDDIEVKIYRQNIGLLLKIMHDDPVFKNKPVCLAINKWDLCVETRSFEDVISTEPFLSFKQQLKNICGENIFDLPVSAFGKHLKDDNEKADPDGRPINVSELLITLAQKAEHAKLVSIKNKLKNLPKFVGWPIYPLFLLKSYFSGATTHRLIQLNDLLQKKYWGRFAVNVAVSGITIILIYSGAATAILWQKYQIWDRQLKNGFNSPDMIARLETEIFMPRTYNFMFGKNSLLKINRLDFRKEFFKRKAEYNRNIIESAKKYRDERIDEIHDFNLSPDIRTKRIGEIITEYKEAEKRLTADAKERNELTILLKEANTWTTHTAENHDFDLAYNKWNNIADEYLKANEAITFLSKYTADKYPDRKGQIKLVQDKQKQIEQEKYNSLFASLRREEYVNDYNDLTTNYRDRIRRAESRITEINNEIEKLPRSSMKLSMIKLKQEEDARIEYLKKYGPFDSEVEPLLASTGSEGIKKISQFIENHERNFSDKRKNSFDDLKKKIIELNTALWDGLNESLKHPDIADVKSDPYKKRIDRAEERKKKIEGVLEKLTVDNTRKDCNDLLVKKKKLIELLSLYGPFDEELKQLLNSVPDTEKSKAIDAFVREFPSNRYPLRQKEYDNLDTIKNKLDDEFYAELEKRLHPRQPGARWQRQKELAEKNIELISSYKSRFADNSDKRAKCDSRIQEEQDFISQLKHDGVFDDAYDNLLKQEKNNGYIRKVADFCIKYNAETYPHRKQKIDELNSDRKEREKGLFGSLTKEDVKETSWKEAVKNYRKKCEIIQNSKNYFVEESYIKQLDEIYNKWSKKADEVEKYGKFDDAWNNVKNDLNGKTPAESIPIIEHFVDQYNKKLYPKRKDIFADADGKLKHYDTIIRNEITKKLSEDNDDLRWDIKIERAEQRISACEEAKKKLSRKSPYLQEFAERLQREKQLIDQIQNYKDYYIAYSEVEAKSDFYRIPAIDAFIKKNRGQYPSPLPRYSMDRLKKDRDKLLQKFTKQCNDELQKNADDLKKEWNDRLKSVNARIIAIEVFDKATGKDSQAQLAQEMTFKKKCEDHIAFSRNIALLKAPFASNKEFFESVHGFYAAYPPEKWWSERKADYQTVKNLEAEKIKLLQKNLEKELKKNTDTSTIEKSIQTYERQRSILSSARDNYLKTMDEYRKITADLEQVDPKIRKFKQLQKANSFLNDLLKEASRLEIKKLDAVGTFLIGVEKFNKQHSHLENDPFIKDKYKKLLSEKDKWNDQIYKQLTGEVESYENTLSSVSDTEKTKTYEEIFNIYQRYLWLLSPDSRQYELACRERDQRLLASDKLKKESKVKNAIESILKIIDDSSLNTAFRIKKIEEFDGTIRSLGSKKEFPRYKTDFIRIEETYNTLKWMQGWYELKGKISSQLDKSPSNDSEEEIGRYIKECQELIKETKKFREDKRTENLVQESVIDLKKCIERHRDIEEECRLYNSLKNSNGAFKRNPTDTSYQKFQNAVSGLKRHSYKNDKHIKEAEELAEKNSAFNKARIELNTRFESFRNEKSEQSLDRFIDKAMSYAKIGGDNYQTRYADKLQNIQKWDKRVTVTLQWFNFNNSGFSSSGLFDVDFGASLSGLGQKIEFKVDDISGKDKNSPEHDYLKKRLGESGIQKQGYASIQNRVILCFGNYNGRDDIGYDSVDFARILAESMDSGECEIVFCGLSERRPKDGYGCVRIKFSGLPRCE